MTNFRNLVAVSATMALAAVGQNVFAQDDLDDLLKELGSDAAEKAEPAEPAAVAEEKAEEAVADVPAAVAEVAEAAEAKVEEVAEKVADAAEAAEEKVEEVAEKVADVAETAEEKAEEAADVVEKKEDDVLDMLDDLSAEKTEEPAAEEPAAVAEVTAEEPAAEEPAAEEPVAVAEVKAEEPVAVAETPKAEETVAEVEPVAPKAPTYTGPDAELIEQLRQTEELRRQAFDKQAKREIEQARICMQSEEYKEAARHYRIAQKLLNDRPASEGLRKECDQGVAEGLYRAAMQEEATGRRGRAIELMNKAVDLRHPKARRQLEQWLASDDPDANKVDISEITHRRNEKDYKDQRSAILKHLKRSRQLMGTKELNRALDECELVLTIDPYNQEAIRLREKIERKMHTIVSQERKAAREGMMADVDKAWRPPYAVDAREIEKTAGQTVTTGLDKDPERAQEQTILKRMREMKLPEISFKPPATIYDAVQFFIGASKDYDRPELPLEERGFGFQMISSQPIVSNTAADDDAEGFGGGDDEGPADMGAKGAAVIPTISVNNISFYDALTLICESVGYKFKVKNGIVVVMPKDMSTEEMVTRSYPVLSSFMDRMSTASSDMKEMRAGGFGGGNNNRNDDSGEENQEKDWKEFFSMLGVQWPEGSSIMYIKTIGKLRVKNTYENLAELEKALTEMNADPKLIEIEARFVEVCQEDLNSLGFEWILNSDYTVGLGRSLGRALGIRNGIFGTSRNNTTTTDTSSGTPGMTDGSQTSVGGIIVPGGTSVSSTPSTSGSSCSGTTPTTPTTPVVDRSRYATTQGASWLRGERTKRNIGINNFGGEGAQFQTGQRYLSTLSNHISGEGYSTNDQFMRVNAFLGGADLSMILHMLSQRSDTDLLSAPKVLTRPGEEAVMKVVTEYIYPTDYDVQLQSSSSSNGGGNSGGSQSAILAVVEPQSFTMREVGVILDVTPTLTDDGNLIDLKLNTQVVDEPTWKNYGMRIPFTGNSSLQSFEGIGGIFEGLTGILTALQTGLSDAMKAAFADTAVNSATTALENLTRTSADNMTYYDAPMEQPFFHVRSIDSNVSVYPGATIVMGGLITEARKAMDDKIPFLGDLPFIGRLFRSHSEQTNKRNLLIFVTTRLVDVRGREVSMGSDETKSEDVKPVPQDAE